MKPTIRRTLGWGVMLLAVWFAVKVADQSYRAARIVAAYESCINNESYTCSDTVRRETRPNLQLWDGNINLYFLLFAGMMAIGSVLSFDSRTNTRRSD